MRKVCSYCGKGIDGHAVTDHGVWCVFEASNLLRPSGWFQQWADTGTREHRPGPHNQVKVRCNEFSMRDVEDVRRRLTSLEVG